MGTIKRTRITLRDAKDVLPFEWDYTPDGCWSALSSVILDGLPASWVIVVDDNGMFCVRAPFQSTLGVTTNFKTLAKAKSFCARHEFVLRSAFVKVANG